MTQFEKIYREEITRDGADRLLSWLSQNGFFNAPASTRYHGAYPGGLADHSVNVYFALQEHPDAKDFTRETIAICGLLHDICKVGFYQEGKRWQKDSKGQWESVPCYTVNDVFPFGHGEKSAYLISQFMKITPEEALAIRWHMGAFDEAAQGGSPTLSAALEYTPLVQALHDADARATYKEKRREKNGCKS